MERANTKIFTRREFLTVALLAPVVAAIPGLSSKTEKFNTREEESLFKGITMRPEAFSITEGMILKASCGRFSLPEVNSKRKNIPIDMFFDNSIVPIGWAVSPNYLEDLFSLNKYAEGGYRGGYVEKINPYCYIHQFGNEPQRVLISILPVNMGLPIILENKNNVHIFGGLKVQSNWTHLFSSSQEYIDNMGFKIDGNVAKISLEEADNNKLTGRLLVVREVGFPLAVNFLGNMKTEEIVRGKIINQ